MDDQRLLFDVPQKKKPTPRRDKPWEYPDFSQLEGSTARKPLGMFSPYAWAIEPTRGCNLRCGHCATRIFEGSGTPAGWQFMSEATWVAMWTIIGKVTPRCRVEMANAGEPTLHPRLLEFIKIARELSPGSQIQVTTNGTKLINGDLTYKGIFEAGANVVYTDMYSPVEQHVALAEASGELFYRYETRPAEAPDPWTYHDDPSIRFICLMNNPANWSEKRKKMGRLGTFLNNLDWEAGKKFNMTPVTEPLQRRCSQPVKYVSVHQNGSYELCCQDFMGETAGKLGTVHDGVEGFYRFWFGRDMQMIRRHLDAKDRAAVSECSRCNITFSRCDVRHWPEAAFGSFWDGQKWNEIEPRVPSTPKASV